MIEKEVKDPLREAKYVSGRRLGNTTRAIDLAIQYLFEGYAISYDIAIKPEREDFLHRLNRRLQIEHRFYFDKLVIERERRTAFLKKTEQ